jgi:hypothetical protein
MKLLKVLVAALLLAAMVTPAIAEDRLSLSGEMRVRAFHVDVDDDSDDDSTTTWANQRLRIAGKIAVAEGVSVTFRTDITEGTNWGDSSSFGSTFGNPERSNGFGSARSGSQQQWDRAHLDLTKNGYHLRAGQLYFGTFGTFAIDTQDNGLVFDFNPGMKVEAFFIVDKNNDTATDNVHDGFLYGLGIQPKGDNWSSRLYVANQNSALDRDENVVAVIASGSLKLDAINLFGEVDFFTGDAAKDVTIAPGVVEDIDAIGTQVMLEASMAATDMITIGGQFFYATGTDKDDEVQYVLLGNGFNGWDPIYDVGTSLSNEEITFPRPFDFTGESAGVVGGRLYSSFKLSDSLNLGASVAYVSEEEDEFVESDGYQLAAGLTYAILDNTSIQLQLQYEDMDYQEVGVATDDDYDAFRAGTGIFVKF